MSVSLNGSKYRSLNGKAAKESPYDHANLVSKYFLYFMLPLFKLGYKGELTANDIGAPPRVDQSRSLGLRLQHTYNQELLTKKKPNFMRALFKTFGSQLALISIFDLLSKCVAFPMQTIALGWLIRDAGIYLTTATTLPAAAAADILPDANVTTPATLLTTTIATAAAAAAAATTTVLPPTLLPPTLPTVPVAAVLTAEEAYWNIIYDAILLMLFTVLAVSLSHPFFFQTYHIGMKCRVAACYLIYKKSLRLSQSAMSQTTVGQMVNLLSNDVNRFDQVAQMLPYIVLAPLQATVVIVVLANFYLGLFATLASLAAITVYVVVQTGMGRGFHKFRSRTAKRTDERVRLMNEIILAMRIIKMYAWERPFKQLVYAARKREISTIGVSSILKAINQTLFFVSSKIIVFVALITFISLGYQLKPEIVFVTIGLANLIRISLTLFFPNAVAYTAETAISCRRINTFLSLPEIESSPGSYKVSNDAYGCKHAITMRKVYAAWTAEHQDLTLSSDSRWAIIRNLNLAILPRDLVLVVGRVGSGKSSVLMSMLGELPIAGGRLELNGRISYASQDAWIFSGTVRENILFGTDFEPERYAEVVRVCSLERDLELLVEGDSTLVGERGVSLSGGQKARVNLARALYRKADIYLLDDPLSAVDAPVAKHIFNESLRTFLRKKTVVLATHQLQFLRYATKVLVLDRDSPAAFGTLEEVMASEAFKVVDYSKEAFEDASTTNTEATDVEMHEQRRKRRNSRNSASGSGSSPGGSRSPPKDKPPFSAEVVPELKEDQNPEQLPESEALIRAESQASSNLNESVKHIPPLGLVEGKKPRRSSKGESEEAASPATKKFAGSDRRQGTEALTSVSADCSTYRYYLSNAAGPIMLTWFVLTNFAAQGLYQYTDLFLSYWTDSVQRHETQGANFVSQTYVDNLSLPQISSVYAALVGLCFFATFCRAATFFAGTLRASISIHDKLFNSVVHAPMTFFDFSPIGILLNRISRDMGFVDETLPQTAIEIVTIFVNVLGIIAITIFIDYKNLAASLLLLLIAFYLRDYCSYTITRLKQIEGVTRSPIFSHISTTLSGIATIRAFKVQEEFGRIFDRHQDTHSSAWFNYICSGRWLTVSMDWLCLCFIGVTVTLLLALSLDATNASLVGLLISQAVVLPGPFQWGMRQLIEAESQMTSVQRIREFSELKPEEDPAEVAELSLRQQKEEADEDEDSAGKRLAKAGQVRFVDVSLSYFSDEPPVLKGLNFTIAPREKVGVVGRTGAGKSSIVAVLFRLYKFDGQVQLDGRDTKSMPLSEVRRSMSIIPQDPILFGATIRRNLDPFSEYSDEQLWDALEAVQLKTLFSRYPEKLEFRINEGGANFSVGQRQLICLARAIVRRNPILVLDEATANVDPETDIFIQRTISNQFAHCTVITIAHRLITIVDSDRVLVLDRGQVSEFGEPYELLSDPSSLFAQMVDSSAQQAPRLRARIQAEHERRVAAAQEKSTDY